MRSETGVRARDLLIAMGLALSCLLMLLVGAARAASPASTYVYSSVYVKEFGYTDQRRAVKKPAKLAIAAGSLILLEAKVKSWRNWGGRTAVAKLRDLRICELDNSGCSAMKKGRPKQSVLKLKRPTRLTCTIGGRERTIWVYKTIVAKNPRQKGFAKPHRQVFAAANLSCPSRL